MEDLVDGLMQAKMMIKRTRMRLEVVVRTREEIIPLISMIKTIEIRDEEVEDKDVEEEAFVENVFIMEKKGIEYLNVPNAKEGQIKEQKDSPELHMLKKMLDHHILKMLKEKS